MSRRTHHRTRSRRHTSSLGTLGAVVLFLAFGFCLGGIAATTPIPDGVIGFVFVVVSFLIWVAAGPRHGRSRRHY